MLALNIFWLNVRDGPLLFTLREALFLHCLKEGFCLRQPLVSPQCGDERHKGELLGAASLLPHALIGGQGSVDLAQLAVALYQSTPQQGPKGPGALRLPPLQHLPKERGRQGCAHTAFLNAMRLVCDASSPSRQQTYTHRDCAGHLS
jgi:hypothetical protein